VRLAGIDSVDGGDNADADRYYARLDLRDGTYKGYAKDGVPDGHGTYKSVGPVFDETYVGDWRDGERNGLGTLEQVNEVSGKLLRDDFERFAQGSRYGTEPAKPVSFDADVSAKNTFAGTFGEGTFDDGTFTVDARADMRGELRDFVSGATSVIEVSYASTVSGHATRTPTGMYAMEVEDVFRGESNIFGGYQGGILSFKGAATLPSLPNTMRVSDDFADDIVLGRDYFEGALSDLSRPLAYVFNLPIESQSSGVTLQGRVSLGEQNKRHEYDINIAENGVCTLSNILILSGPDVAPVSGEDLSDEVVFKAFVKDRLGLYFRDIDRLRAWKVQRSADGGVVFYPSNLPSSEGIENMPAYQAVLDDEETYQERQRETARQREGKLEYEGRASVKALRALQSVVGFGLGFWTLFVGASYLSMTISFTRWALKTLQRAAAAGKLKAKNAVEQVNAAREERRGYAGLDVDKLLPEPPRPGRRAASPARRRPTDATVCMVDSVVDAYLATRAA